MPDATASTSTKPAGQGGAVEVRAVTRRFGEQLALDAIDLSIRDGEFFALLGPSGCGKTTLLRLIGGLDLPDSGSIRIGGVEMQEIPAHKRPVNTVFQSYALFPHLDVRDNVAFGLRMKKVPEAEVATRVAEAMDLVQIGAFATRRPQQLSGGQRQRVALARAIVNRPRVLLLDEPLGALDLKLRKELQVELLALQRRLGITFVFVTHDQEEALVLADRIAVMRGGRIEQLGVSEDLYEHPRTRFVAQFLGSANLIDGTVAAVDQHGLVVEGALGRFRCAGKFAEGVAVGVRSTLAIRPEKVEIAAEPARENALAARVEQVIYSGSTSSYQLRARDGSTFGVSLINTLTTPSFIANGTEVQLRLPPENLIALAD
jgi:spermidine/putrescine transport system ATP-binding protein